MRDWFRFVIPAGLGILAIPVLQSAADVEFAREIQPIFAESCYSCHGPKVQMAGLRLDVRPGGSIIVPGNAAGSVLMQRLSATDAQTRMPHGRTTAGGGEDRTDPQMDRRRRRVAGSARDAERRSEEALGVCGAGATGRAAHRAGRTGCATLSTHLCWRGWNRLI